MWETSQSCQVMTCLLLIALPAVHPVRQDLSVAGLRKGLEGERSGLFMEQIRITKEMRERARRDDRSDDPGRYLVWENVPGAFSSNAGRDFQAVLTEIVRIAEPNAPDVPLPEKGKWPKAGCLYDELANWSVAWRTHDSQWWGVPQRRKRISVLADFSGLTAPEIMFDPQYRRTSEDGKPIETFSDIGTGTRQQVQPFSKSLPGDSEQGKEEREGTAGSTQTGIGAAGKCLNGWDVQSKHIQPADGIAEALYAGECRYAGGESYVMPNAISFQERAGKPGGRKRNPDSE